MRQPNWTRILTILLVILATFAILYITGTILLRFTGTILLFVLGAMLAYILNPLVNRLELAFHYRWLAVLLAYFFVAAGLLALGVLLFTPFIQQSQSLIDNLHNPSRSGLIRMQQVQQDSERLRDRVLGLAADAGTGFGLDARDVETTREEIAHLRADVAALKGKKVSSATGGSRNNGTPRPGKQPSTPPSQTQVPPSYVTNVLIPVDSLSTLFDSATATPGKVDRVKMNRAAAAARRVAIAAEAMNHTMATTPILLLHAQVWLDMHKVHVDLASKLGEVASQVSNQGTYLLDNAITILSETANILLNTVLILIISVYLVNDGNRIMRGLALVIPPAYREQAWFFVTSLDSVLGGYIRGQLFLSALAGVLGGGGAAILGVPYPLLIGLLTFVLESVPVIGPMVAVVPAVIISLFFNSILTTVLMLIWFVVYQQIVTNLLGPRVMGMAVGIHPLEALLAVMVGYPLGGLLGAFLAVPIAGIVHIFVRESYAYFALGKALPTAPVPPPSEAPAEEPEAAPASPTVTRKVTPAP